MALIDNYRVLNERGALYKRLVVACWSTANAVAAEAADVPNHADRLALADRIHSYPEAANAPIYERAYNRMLTNTAILQGGDETVDADIEYAASYYWDALADWWAAQ